MKMTAEYANLLGGKVASLLTENADEIDRAFVSHQENLKISATIQLSIREAVSGKTNRAGVAISFDPYPKEKGPDKIKHGIAFDYDPKQLKFEGE